MKVNINYVSTAVAIWMLQFNYFIGMSTYKYTGVGKAFENVCLIVAIIAIIIHYIFDKNVRIKKSSFVLICLLPIMAFYTVAATSGGTMIKMLMFALSFKGIPKKQIWKYYYKSTITALFFIFISSCLGIIEKTKILKNGTYAYGFGLNPNILAIAIFFVLIIRLYLLEKKPKIWWEGIIVAIIINEIIKCRSAVVLLALLSLIMFFHIMRNIDIRILAWVGSILPVAMSFFSIFIAQNFDMNNTDWLRVNRFMSARPYLYHLYYINFPINLFGNYFDKTNYGAMDNTYLMLLFRYGIFIYVIYMIIFLITVAVAKKRQDRWCLYITIIYFVYFCIEYSPSIMNLNFVLIYFWLEFWEKNSHIKRGRIHDDKCYYSSI